MFGNYSLMGHKFLYYWSARGFRHLERRGESVKGRSPCSHVQLVSWFQVHCLSSTQNGLFGLIVSTAMYPLHLKAILAFFLASYSLVLKAKED